MADDSAIAQPMLHSVFNAHMADSSANALHRTADGSAEAFEYRLYEYTYSYHMAADSAIALLMLHNVCNADIDDDSTVS